MDNISPENISSVNIPAELDSFLRNAESLCAAVIRDGHVVQASDEFASVFGYSDACDVAGLAWNALVESGLAQHNCVRADGSRFPGEVIITPWASEKELELAIVRVTAETNGGRHECLKKCEAAEQYRTLVEQAIDGIFLCNEKGFYTDINTSGCETLGYTREELRQMGPLDIVIPEERARLLDEMKQIREGKAVSTPWTILRKDGSRFPAEVSASVLSDGMLLGILRDVSTRVAAQEQLRASESLLRQFVQKSPAAVAMFDTNMRYLLYSERWLQDYKLGDANLIGKLHYDIFPEALASKDYHDRCLAGNSERCDSDPFPRPDGSLDYVKWEVCPWRDGCGEIGGIIMFTEVITDRVEADKELRNDEEKFRTLVEQLERAYKLQREFLNNVTHEVRTPLTAVMGYAEMLIDGFAGPLNDEQIKLLKRVLSSSQHLLDIIGSVLEISRIRSGNMQPILTVCNPSSLINKVLASVAPQAHKKGLSLSVANLDMDAPCLFDVNMLTVILTNLVSNAVKFTQTGGIEIATQSHDKSMCITVTDTGIGIPEDSLTRIFDEFEQVDAPRKYKPEGFGIGLAIVYQMIHAMGASLTVSSAPGVGTAFTLCLPSSAD